MIDFTNADAHIHLFEGGYQAGSLTSRPGVEVDELLCFQSLMKDHHIEAALFVGFEVERPFVVKIIISLRN